MGQFRFRNLNWNRNRPLFKLDGIGIGIESTPNFSVGIGIGIGIDPALPGIGIDQFQPDSSPDWNLDPGIGIEPTWNRNWNR